MTAAVVDDQCLRLGDEMQGRCGGNRPPGGNAVFKPLFARYEVTVQGSALQQNCLPAATRPNMTARYAIRTGV